MGVVALLAACTPTTDHGGQHPPVGGMVVHSGHAPGGPARMHPQQHHPMGGMVHQTIRPIRPDATGAFPGDYSTVWNAKPAYEAAHMGGGMAGMADGGGKYGGGKYGPAAPESGGKYSGPVDAGAHRPVPGHSAYEAHRVYRPPMDCAIVSQTSPEPWIGHRYICVEH